MLLDIRNPFVLCKKGACKKKERIFIMRFYVFLPPVRGCLNGFAAGVTCLERADCDIKIGIFREGFLLGCKTDNFCKIAFRGTFTKVMPFYPFKKWLGFIFPYVTA